MDSLKFSLIVPVFNRPKEVEELLESLSLQEGTVEYEILIIEDGSTVTCESVCSRFRESLPIHYHFKENSGPGESRNYGMKLATGNYFLIFDSDCIIPPHYLVEVERQLKSGYVDCFGGPDAAQEHFSDVQKAINYSMTSFLTTGGIRGGSEALGKFQPRSFNMGISKTAFETTHGFGKIHPGEDPDLTIRLWKNGFKTRLFKNAYVYHKRRISFDLFFKQVKKFGSVRVILNKWHPETAKLTYWFPLIFISGFLVSLLLSLAGFPFLLICYGIYFLAILVNSSIKYGLWIGCLTVWAVMIQFTGYGIGFLKAFVTLKLLGRNEEKALPHLFFK